MYLEYLEDSLVQTLWTQMKFLMLGDFAFIVFGQTGFIKME